MTKKAFTLLIISILLISNLLLAGFIIFGNKGPHRPPPRDDFRPRNTIIHQLGFDKAQADQFHEIVLEHQEKIHAFDKQIVDIKKRMYNALPDNSDPVDTEALTKEIAAIQQEIELTHVAHFQDIKAICRPDQQENFSKLMKEVVSIFHRKKPPRR
ncbi:MAG: periplasmic heavy metal sensor [Bacteroidia bacterium]